MTDTPRTRTGFAQVSGAPRYYEVIGDGRPLVLLHEGFADSRMVDDQVATFAARFQVVRYDRHGAGLGFRGGDAQKGAAMTPEETVLTYVESWLPGDAGARAGLLERCWAEHGVYQDPMNRAEGREQLAGLIVGFAQRRPGARILLASGVDEHHRLLRFRWVMLAADGSEVMEGFDVGELAEDGRLRRITGFFGPFPPAPDSWPERLVRPRDRDC